MLVYKMARFFKSPGGQQQAFLEACAKRHHDLDSKGIRPSPTGTDGARDKPGEVILFHVTFACLFRSQTISAPPPSNAMLVGSGFPSCRSPPSSFPPLVPVRSRFPDHFSPLFQIPVKFMSILSLKQARRWVVQSSSVDEPPVKVPLSVRASGPVTRIVPPRPKVDFASQSPPLPYVLLYVKERPVLNVKEKRFPSAWKSYSLSDASCLLSLQTY